MRRSDAVLSIGRFAYASGLTVKALRHYDEIGLLRPARVDASSGYRYYEPTQLRDAAMIRRLRRLEVPLDEIRLLVSAEPADLRMRLAEHRARIAASTEDKRRLLAELDRLITEEEELVPNTELEIEICDFPELRLASLVRQVHIDDMLTAVPRMLDAVGRWVDARQATQLGPPVGVFRSGDRENWHIVEAGWPVEAHVEPDDFVGIHTYPASRAATYEYLGPYEALDSVAQRFIASVTLRGLSDTQPIRVEYLKTPARNPPAEQRSRIVWPIE